MNDLFFIRYEPRLMLVDCMDMPPEVELAHRRLADFLWASDGPPDDNVTLLVRITLVKESDWARVRGGLERKGWYTDEKGKFTHRRIFDTLLKGRDLYTLHCNQTKAATEARKKRNVNVTSNVTKVVTTHQSESESEYSNKQTNNGVPTLEQVRVRAAMTGMLERDAIDFWNHFESSGWIDKNGHQIVKWQSKMDTWKVVCRSKTIEQSYTKTSSNSCATDKILMSKELDRVESKIAEVKNQGSSMPFGIEYNDIQKEELKALRKRQRELKSSLGFQA